MSLVFDRGNGGPDKPDNSPTFFSARKPASTVLLFGGVVRNTGNSVDHPWRYFLAAGDSLAKMLQLIADSQNVDSDLQALATEVGAKSASYGTFVFEDAEVEPVPPRSRLQYVPNNAFVCDVTAAGNFFPDPRYPQGRAVKEEIVALKDLPAGEVDAGRAALAKKYGAESFDGNFFRFPKWERNVESAPKEDQQLFRLKSNPAFVRDEDDDDDCFNPDLESDDGFRIAVKVDEILSRRSPQTLFAQWISSFELDISLSGRINSRDRLVPEAEKIGDEWIIKVPVVVEGIYGADGKGGNLTGLKEGWVMPPGTKPIAISEYYAKLEKSGSLRALPETATASA